MLIQPTVQQGVPSPSLVAVFDEICAAKDSNQLLFVLAKWMDINFEEPTNLTSWVLALNRLDALMDEIAARSGRYLVLPERRADIAMPPAELMEHFAFDLYALMIVLRFTSLLLLNSTNKDIYSSVERLMLFLKAYDDDISRLALECILSLVTPPPTQRCLTFTNHVTLMHKNAGLCLPLFQIVEFSRGVSSYRAADFLSTNFNSEPSSSNLVFSMVSKSRHAQSSIAESRPGETGSDVGPGDLEGRVLEIPQFLNKELSLQDILRNEIWFPMEHAFPLLTQMRTLRAFSSQAGRIKALRMMYQAILVLLCCHPSSATLSDFFHDKTEILMDFIYLLRSGPGTPEYDESIPFDIRVLACQSLVAVVGSRDVSSVSVMGRFSWLQHDLGVNRGQYMGLLPCLLRSAATFLSSRHDGTCEYATEITVAGESISVISWASRVARASQKVTQCDNALEFAALLVQTPPSGLMTVASFDKIREGLAAGYNDDAVVTASTLRAWILAAQDKSPVYSSDYQIQYSPVYLTRLLWTEQILILTTAVISATSALPALVDSGFIALVVGVIADPLVRDHTDLQLSYIEATLIQMLELSISDSSVSMNIFKDMNGADTLLDRLLCEINDSRFGEANDHPATGSVAIQISGLKRKRYEEDHTAEHIVVDSSSDIAPTKVGPGVGYALRESHLMARLRGGMHTMLPSTNVIIHSLLSALSIYLQEGSDSRLSHLLRGKKFSGAMMVLFRNNRFLASPVFAFAYSILSEVVNNDPGFLSYIIGNGLVKLALKCCNDLDIKRFEITNESDLCSQPAQCLERAHLNDALFLPASRAVLQLPELTAELVTSMISFVSAVALTKDGLDLINAVNPFEGFCASFTDFRSYSPFSNVMMNDLPRSIGSSLEDLIRHYPLLSDQCMKAFIAVIQEVVAIVERNKSQTFEASTSNGISHLTYLHTTTALLQCLNQILARKVCADFFFSEGEGVPLLVRLLQVGLSAPRSFLAALAASTEPTTNSMGHYPIVKSVAQCIVSLSQHEPKQLSEEIFMCLRNEYDSLNDCLELYWGNYERESGDGAFTDDVRVARVPQDNLKHFLDSVSRKRLHQCYIDGEMPSLLFQFTDVLRHFVTLNYLVENLAAVLQIISSRAHARFSATNDPFIKPSDCEILNLVINKLYVSSQEELCAARGNLVTGNKKGKPKAHPVYRLLIISHEHVVIRASPDADNGKKVGKLPKGTVVDAYERCTGNDNALRYRIKEGWIGFYRNNAYGDPQVEVIELLEKTPAQLSQDEAQSIASLNTPQKKFDFEKFANVSPRRGGFMTMFHFHCCIRHLLSVTAWSFLPAPGKSFPEQTYVLLPLITSCLASLLPLVSSVSELSTIRPDSPLVPDTANHVYFVRHTCPSPDSFTISDSFRAIHAVELCHHLLFDEKKGHGETNILLLLHLFKNGFVERLLEASALVFLTCLRSPASSNSLRTNDSVVDVTDPERVLTDDDGIASDCSSDVEESVKRDWHQKRLLKERRMLAVTNIDIVIELWKLFFGSMSLSSRASTLLKESCDSAHDFDIIVLKHQLYSLQVKYLFQTWSHPSLYTLPPTSARHVLELVNVISKSLWGLTQDVPSVPSRGNALAFGARSGSRTSQAHRGISGSRGMPFSLQQLLSSNGIDGFSARELGDGNVSVSFGAGGPFGSEDMDIIDDSIRPSGDTSRQRGRSNSLQSTGSRGRQRGLSITNAQSVSSPEAVFVCSIPRLEHILPSAAKLTAEELKGNKDLIAALSTIVYNSVPAACLELISRGLKAPGVQWRTEAALLNQNITREDTTVMVLTMMSSCLEVTKWSETLRSVVRMTSIIEPVLDILLQPLTAESSSRLYGLLHALVLVFSGNKFELLLLLVLRSSRYCQFPKLLIDHIEHRLIQPVATIPTCTESIAGSLWITPALLFLDCIAQPVFFDKATLAMQIAEISVFINPVSRTMYGDTLSKFLPTEFINHLTSEFGTPVGTKMSRRARSKNKTVLEDSSNDLEISNFIEKHGGLERDASAADINIIKQTTINDCNEPTFTNDVECISKTDLSAHMPLLDNGLCFELRIKCVNACLGMIDLCTSSDAKVGPLIQAICQLLVHLTRDRALAEVVQLNSGIEKLVNVAEKFDGASAYVFTLILHVLEDDQYLLHSMDATIKVCLHRLRGTVTPTFKSFIEILAPLMYRNQSLFLEAAKKCIRIRPSGLGHYDVCGVDEVQQQQTSKQQTPNSSVSALPASVENVFSDIHKPAKVPIVHTQNAVSATPEPVAMKEILDVLVHKLLEQWLYFSCESKDGDCKPKVKCLLTMADIITLLADLVCTVPGFATCIHKFQYSPSCKGRPGAARPVTFEVAFTHMKHCLTGEPLHSTHFVTFLVHYLLSCDFPQQVSQTCATNKLSEALPTVVRGTDAKVLKDSVCYLLVALISRPGDGRRRVLKEVLGGLKLGGVLIDTNAKFNIVGSLVQCVQSILNPKPAWKQRNLLTVPYKDIIMTVVSLKAYGILSEALFAISVEHPFAIQISEQISVPLEFLIRKGLPMYEEMHAAEKENMKVSEKSSTRRDSYDGSGLKACKSPHESLFGAAGASTSERPPTGPRNCNTRNSATTPASGLTAANRGLTGGGRGGDYDFFSPLVSSSAVDRRDTMTTDDDRDVDRLEHHGTLENDLRLLSQPSQASGPLGNSGMLDIPVEDMDDDDDGNDVDLESILSSGSEDDEEEDFDEDEDEEDEDDDDIVVDEDEDGDAFDEHSLDEEDGEGEDEEDSENESEVDQIDADDTYEADVQDDVVEEHEQPPDMEISITFEPQVHDPTDGHDNAYVTSSAGSRVDSINFAEEVSRLVAAARSESSRDMLPPTRRPDAGRRGHHRRAYESTFQQAELDDDEIIGGYDSALDLFDSRENEELIHGSTARSENDEEYAGEWVTVNHGDEVDDDGYPNDEAVQNGNPGRSYIGHAVGSRGRQRLSDLMEAFHAPGRAPGLSGGAVRIAGENLMGFLGNLPIPDFLRDSLAHSEGGGIRHMVAHFPMNEESMDHDEEIVFGMDPSGFPSVRDALSTLMRPNRGHNRVIGREGAASNPAPSRHPLVDNSIANGRGRGASTGRGRGSSFVDAIISAVDGPNNGSDGYSVEDKQQMKTVLAQRRRLLGSLISDRRWGTDVGDREMTGCRLNQLSQALIQYYKSTEVDIIVPGISNDSDSGTDNSPAKILESFFLPQSSEVGMSGRAGRIPMSTSQYRMHRGESKEEADLQESKEETESSLEEDPSSDDLLSVEQEVVEASGNTQISSNGATDSSNALTAAAESSIMSTTPVLPVVVGDTRISSNTLNIQTQTAVEINQSALGPNQCPEGYDPEVWASLPSELQLEVLGYQGSTEYDPSEESAMLDQTELDRTALEALPAAMRSEILREEVVERRRRESIDQTNVDSSDISAMVSTFGSQIGADLQSTEQNSSLRPSAAQENYLFITSLPPDLRQEALLGADEEFISSLPQSIRQEAEALRERHQVRSGASSGARTESEVRAGHRDQPVNEGESAGEVYHRLYSQLVSGNSTASRRGARANAEDIEKEVILQPTTVFFEDNRVALPPFGPRLVSRILHYVVSGTSTRMSRALTRLLCTLCRYQSTRLCILRALICVLLKDAQEATECLLQIPRESYKTYCFRKSNEEEAFHCNPTVSKTDTDYSLLAEMDSIATAIGLANQVQGTLCVRRLLHLVGSLVKHTDRLVWYDIMNQAPRFSDALTRPDHPVTPASESTAGEWMFQKLISLLGDQRVLQECDIDSVLYLLGELCEPLSRLTVVQVTELVVKQSTVDVKSMSLDIDPEYNLSIEGADFENNLLVAPNPKRRRIDHNYSDIFAESATSNVGNVTYVGTSSADPEPNNNAVNGMLSAQLGIEENPAEISYPFPVLSVKSVELLATLAKSEYCGGPGRNRLSRIMCTLSLYEGNWRQLVSSLSCAAEGLIGSTEVECRKMLTVLTRVVEKNGSAADATSLPELSTPSSVSETRLLRVFRLMGSLRNSIDGTSGNSPGGSGAQNNPDFTPMTLSGSAEERAFVAEHISGINFGSLWGLLCQILDQIRGLEGINEEITANYNGGVVQAISAINSLSSANANANAAIPGGAKQPFLSSLTMRFMPLIECYMTVSGATLLRVKRPDRNILTSLNSFSNVDVALSSALPQTPVTSSSLLRAASSLVLQKVSVPGARFRQHKAYMDMHMDIIDNNDATRFLHFAEANKSLLNMILRQNIPLLESSFSPFVLIPRLRSLLHFDIKRAYFKLKLKKLKQSVGRNFGSLRIAVHRSSVMEDSFQKLRFCSADEMRKRLSVTFLGEEGIDAGGLTREWFSLLAKEIFNVNYCLFTATHDNVTFQPNPYSGINPDHLGYFKFVGRIIGKAICDGQLLDAHFTRSFYKHMLGIPVGYQDLEALEPEYFKSLMAIVEHPLDLLGLDLTFSAELNEFGRVEIVDMIENGRNIPVTDENKSDYIRLIANHRMTNSIRKQIDSFLEGFHETIPPELISIFDAQELELIISGLPDIDLDDLRAHTDYQGYKATDPVINYFWSALRSFSKEEKALFLQFVTGTSKVPLEGFQALYGARGPQQFNIHKAYGTHLLPSAHTCFNQLDLPEYATEDELREKLLIALHEGSEGFGFA